ncbi:biotin carboxylase N-terminal domain-containing protein [Kocuria rhizophila]|uniref:ATP-binding protein n=1 Tax=Kocuria rhizophila TaxID=72000 RepID=UPI00190A3AE3|nr:biotin carboxylase N-terminal domain-containing protein [Kocuria rhizophila]MBK4121060.1 ATP-grasp domain-containing protein [Kocuria rhizophila]
MFSTVLVANRGEIAVRVMRTLRAMGIRSVAVYSDADACARHVKEADVAVRIGPAAAAESYLDIDAVVAAARETGAEAVHPGYGFLAENVDFARACAAAGIAFIGPRERALEIMGDKIASKLQVAEHGVPLVQGVSEPGLTDEQLVAAAADMPFPVLIKPSAGGGGKGMQVVERYEDLAEALPAARRVAKQSFGDDTLLIEQLVATPRHIEVQVLADTHGHVIHLGERECSLQRRHQKVIEEAPSALLDAATRARIGEAAVAAAKAVDYVGAGTVEFLVSDREPDTFYFMEMNTRLQVEHPVTEMVTGVDLVEWQVRIADGEHLTLTQEDVHLDGHAVEARVYAENPARGFLPTEGTVVALRDASGPGVRVDSGIMAGQRVGLDYDPMLAKVIAHGPDRRSALQRLRAALEDTVILGVGTNVEYLHMLLTDEDVVAGRMDTGLIERKLPQLQFAQPDPYLEALAAHVVLGSRDDDAARAGSLPDAPDAGTVTGPVAGTAAHRDRLAARRIGGTAWRADGFSATAALPGPAPFEQDPSRAVVTAVGAGNPDRAEGRTAHVSEGAASFEIPVRTRTGALQAQLAQIERETTAGGPELRSPMPGTVVAVLAESGEQVAEGRTVVTVEAMKMEHPITATLPGTVTVLVGVGDRVKVDQVVATIETDDTGDAGGEAPAA